MADSERETSLYGEAKAQMEQEKSSLSNTQECEQRARITCLAWMLAETTVLEMCNF